ncbi:MAG TPA: HD domain-containing protein [Variovorax sp.]
MPWCGRCGAKVGAFFEGAATVALTLSEIETLLASRGQRQYGNEAVSQLDHALQCAWLAEQAGRPTGTIVAALLHDLGHLLTEENPGSAEQRDDLHQFLALPFLRGLFPEAVLAPIRLHVDAKRYLCATDPNYLGILSPASVRSLALQGGVYSEAQARTFIDLPFAPEAVALRRHDDEAKTPGRATPPLAHFIEMMSAVALHTAPADGRRA